MPNVVCVSESMREDYDSFIQAMPSGSFRQGYAWGEVMSYDYDIIRLAVMRRGTIVAAISLQRKKLPYIPFTFLYAPRGPIVNYSDQEAITELLKKIKSIARDGNSIFLRIDPDFLDEDLSRRQILLDNGFSYLQGKDWSYFNYPRILMRLDTTPDETVLKRNLRKKHRQHINNLSTKGVVISEVTDQEGLRSFYGLMIELSVRKGFPVRSFEYYQKLVSCFGQDLKIFLASNGSQILAGVMALMYGNKCWYMHGATVGDKGNFHPAEGLHWEMIKWAKSRGGGVYDLGGTGTEYPPREDNPNYPLYHFKEGFGAEISYLTGYYDMIFNAYMYSVFRYIEDKGLPCCMKSIAFFKKRFSHHE